MSHAETVTVYSFRSIDQHVEGMNISSFKAPRQVIRERYHGQVLEGTAEEVEANLLDDEGRYRRIATGWGELN